MFELPPPQTAPGAANSIFEHLANAELDSGKLDRLDNALYDLEADHPADELLDEYVSAHRSSFFRG